jgi:TolA-binding protein
MPKATVARRAASGPPASPPPAKVAGGRRWAADLARGSWDGILADVDREGVDATLENASSDDLFALADAARYRRRTDLARAALLAQRRRFPRSPRSLDAIFLLGRVEELRAQGAARAIASYDEYLTHAPTGAYAAEALGRKMILTDERDGRAAARPIADEYLRRFPGGSYAGSARALQRGP